MSDILVQGWTERIKYALTVDGVALNLTGLTVALVGVSATRATLTFSGTTGVDDEAAGKVYFDPAPTDLLAANSPYCLRWAITDGAGKTAYFPRLNPLQWDIKTP